jgi:hypothetical protein
LESDDAPVALLPDGNVLVAPGPVHSSCSSIPPTEFFEFDGTNLTVSPNNLSFGSVAENQTSAAKPITVTNKQSVALTALIAVAPRAGSLRAGTMSR